VDLLHSGDVMYYNGYIEPQDGAMSVLFSSQQEAVVCVCVVFRKKVTVVKGSCLGMVVIENITV
jgi:hypothetical protein